MRAQSIDEVWDRVRALEGSAFETKTGKSFTYTVVGEALRPSRTEYHIAKSELRKALAVVPFDGPGRISNEVRGPSYVYAILHDHRVRRNDW